MASPQDVLVDESVPLLQEKKPREAEDEEVPSWLVFCTVLPVCGLIMIPSVPYMSFGLFKVRLQTLLQLTQEQSGYIVSAGMTSASLISFLPGLLYDKAGFRITLLVGGVVSLAGALTWWWVLSSEGAEPTWEMLAATYALLSVGARFQYVAGMCAALNAFPKHMAARISGIMASLLSVGYIVVPQLYKLMLAGEKVAGTLEPVAKFHLLLAGFYAVNTVLGLAVSPFFTAKASKETQEKAPPDWAGRAAKLRSPVMLSLIMMLMLTLCAVYTYQSAAVGEMGHRALAGASTPDEIDEQVANLISAAGIGGLVSRFVHGFGVDFLASTRAGGAAQHLGYLLSTTCVLAGFGCFCLFPPGGGRNAWSWTAATYLLTFGFGGYFALFPATVRVAVGKDDLGFFLGTLFALIGLAVLTYQQVGATMDWSVYFWMLVTAGAALNIVNYAFMVRKTWGT